MQERSKNEKNAQITFDHGITLGSMPHEFPVSIDGKCCQQRPDPLPQNKTHNATKTNGTKVR